MEADPELAGPWWQLFSQIQRPRHVLSELLQNADDAGARSACVTLEGNRFVFEHDGEDFDEEQFSSLCGFGYSNKRRLHTIGFRGVGFKSVFSLGDTVEVQTPTLAICFNRQRFSEPVWVDSLPSTDRTRITITVKDSHRTNDIRQSLADWTRSLASILFFTNIQSLQIGETLIERSTAEDGPCDDSWWITLRGERTYNALLVRSREEEFPEDAMSEIREERLSPDLQLCPCSVDVVMGLPGTERLYVVLPTDVDVNLPFSCNAPFMQDPARTGLKDPSTSPTNRWLLRRIGVLAAETMLAWLDKDDLPIESRVRAYELLPSLIPHSSAISKSCIEVITEAFRETVRNKRTVLCAGGRLIYPERVVAPPVEAYEIWDTDQLPRLFGEKDQPLLAGEIPAAARNLLERWKWISLISRDDLIARLCAGSPPPRPTSWDRLVNLWQFVVTNVQYDYGGLRRARAMVIPVSGKETLLAAGLVVRMPDHSEVADPRDIEFVSKFVDAIDHEWIRYIERLPAVQRAKCVDLLQSVTLARPSSWDAIMAAASHRLFAVRRPDLAAAVRLTHIMAARDCKVPDDFRYFTRDGAVGDISSGLLFDPHGDLEAILPPAWSSARLIHDYYYGRSSCCSTDRWLAWGVSSKSGLRTTAFPTERAHAYISDELRDFFKSRNVVPSSHYPKKSPLFQVRDFDFDPVLIRLWKEQSPKDSKLWSRVLSLMLEQPDEVREILKAEAFQETNKYLHRLACDPIPAAWVIRFRTLKCLPDIHGVLHEPAALLMRTADTEALMGVEPFLHGDVDVPKAREILKFLGVRDTPTGPASLIERMRQLTAAQSPPIHEVAKWYDALDRLLARSRPDDLQFVRDAFAEDQLILTADCQWADSSEVFRLVDCTDVPDAASIHPDVAGLSMWSRIGVAERPTLELILKWINSLKDGTKLEGHTLRRVEACLRRYAVQVWVQCAHWLTLDNHWSAIGKLSWTHASPGTRIGELFPAIRARTADLRMIGRELLGQAPFTSLPELGSVLQYRISDCAADSDPIAMPWLRQLGRELCRVRLMDDEKTALVRDVAQRLLVTRCLRFWRLSVTPYVDGTPAGQAHDPKVLWDQKTLYVPRGPMAAAFNAMVGELARPFGLNDITDAIRSCIERNDDFISSYIRQNFETDDRTMAATTQPDSHTEAKTGGWQSDPRPDGDGIAIDTGTSCDGTDGEIDIIVSDPGNIRVRHHKPSLMAQYAASKNFQPVNGIYRNRVGVTIVKSDPPFHWEMRSPEGELIRRFWVNSQFAEDDLEVPTGVWETIVKNPKNHAMILSSGKGEPVEMLGLLLRDMRDTGAIEVAPSQYRIVRIRR